jgi:hypothetical protein
MKRNIVLLVIGSFVVSIATVVVLFAMSGIMKDKRNSFLREFPPHPAIEGDTFNIKYGTYYIAGVSSSHIYLGNYRAPLHMLVLNMALTDSQHVKLNLKGVRDQKFWSARVKVDSPQFYLIDGAVPIVYKGNVNDWSGEKLPNDSTYFREFIPLNASSFVVKSLSGAKGENILGKIASFSPFQVFTDKILQKQLDGVFCTDGILDYNKELNQLIYLYYYRNQFIVMDTMVNLIYRGNTIDTISRAKVKVATIESENSKTLSSPPYFVNKACDTSGDLLFINSNLLAKNEHQEAFNDGNVIDMYNLKTGKYIFSFYIYHFFGKKKMSEFRVIGDKMVVRYDNLIRIWHLKPEYFAKNNLVTSINKHGKN